VLSGSVFVLPSHVVENKILRPNSQPSEAKTWTFEAKAIGPWAKAFKYMVGAEIKICTTSDSLRGYVMNSNILIAFA